MGHKIIRYFHPVGQGAFYTEQHFDEKDNFFTLVYDCGSENENELSEEIEHSFAEGHNIDALFISHFHYDHINGIEELIATYTIKNIFLPLLPDEEKLIEIINLAYNNKLDSARIEFIISPKEWIKRTSKETKIIEIETTGKNEWEEEGDEPQQFDSIGETITGTSTISIPAKKTDWVLIPFNFRDESRRSSLIEKLKKGLPEIFKGNEIDFDKIKKEFEKLSKPLKKIYESVKGSLNTNSLVLYSGPRQNGSYFLKTVLCNRHFCHDSRGGCWYLGDYNASGHQKCASLLKRYARYHDRIGTVQIPHHGSKHNFHSDLIKSGGIRAIISHGENNRHRHPHKETLVNLLAHDSCIQSVTERTGTRYIEEIVQLRP